MRMEFHVSYGTLLTGNHCEGGLLERTLMSHGDAYDTYTPPFAKSSCPSTELMDRSRKHVSYRVLLCAYTSTLFFVGSMIDNSDI